MIREGGVLSDIAPALLHLMDIGPPAEMTGQTYSHRRQQWMQRLAPDRHAATDCLVVSQPWSHRLTDRL